MDRRGMTYVHSDPLVSPASIPKPPPGGEWATDLLRRDNVGRYVWLVYGRWEDASIAKIVEIEPGFVFAQRTFVDGDAPVVRYEIDQPQPGVAGRPGGTTLFTEAARRREYRYVMMNMASQLYPATLVSELAEVLDRFDWLV